MSSRRLQYLAAMGIQSWSLREKHQVRIRPEPAKFSGKSAEPAVPPAVPRPGDPSLMDWEALQATVRECTRCGLAGGRIQTVFGAGNPESGWLIVGEAPGAEEDRRGEPFVGRAGQLLDRMLFATGLQREAVYITNVVKCRPPGNRDPGADEVEACAGYLKRQIALLKPRLILALGRFAAQTLLQTDTPVGQLRGHVHLYGDTLPLIVTYHPAYLLRSPEQKRLAWDDLLLARTQLEGRA